MKYASLVVFALLLIAALPSCKKGENDPFLSLRTRRARLSGDWKLTHAETIEHTVNAQSTVTVQSVYDGTLETSTQHLLLANGNADTNDYTLAYTHFITIRKDGTYKQTYSESGIGTVVTEGTWIFLRKSREKDLKNKEAILLTATSTNVNGTVTTSTDLIGQVYAIDLLKHNEMTWINSYGHSSGNVLHSYDRRMTFTPRTP